MSTNARAAMVPVSRRVRAYFAPYDPAAGKATIYDPARHGAFPLDAPPIPWIDLGWIDNFQRTSGTVTDVIRAGASGAPAGQYRANLNAQVELDFCSWGKLQMALAGGAEHMNVLECDGNADPRPGGGFPLAAAPLLAGSSAGELVLGLGAVDRFSLGDVVAVDVNFADVAGWVGTGIAAGYVSDPAHVKHDPNYIRRVTFNVGRITAKTATSLLLGQPLLGGAPLAGASVQKVIAFLDREGGSLFRDWSALFVVEEESGGRVCYHYPHLSPTRPNGAGGLKAEAAAPIGDKLAALAMHASFVAFPYSDEADGQPVLCYRSLFPAGTSAVY